MISEDIWLLFGVCCGGVAKECAVDGFGDEDSDSTGAEEGVSLLEGEMAIGVLGVISMLGSRGGMVVGIERAEMDAFCCLCLKRW